MLNDVHAQVTHIILIAYSIYNLKNSLSLSKFFNHVISIAKKWILFEHHLTRTKVSA